MTAKQDAFSRVCERMQVLMADKQAMAPHGQAPRIGDLVRRIGVAIEHRKAA